MATPLHPYQAREPLPSIEEKREYLPSIEETREYSAFVFIDQSELWSGESLLSIGGKRQ